MRKGFTLWLTGIPGGDKKTLAQLLSTEFRERGVKVELIDGDVIRQGLGESLDPGPAGRDEHLWTLASACGRLARDGAACILATAPPSPVARERARREIGEAIEVHVTSPAEAPPEVRIGLEIVVLANRESPGEAARRIVRSLEERGYLPRLAGAEAIYSEEEETAVRQRLEDLGYL